IRSAPWPRDPDGTPLYPGTCRELPQEEVARRLADSVPHTWRLDVATAVAEISEPLSYRRIRAPSDAGTLHRARPEAWGDAVIVRRDVPTSYHLSVVVDDALQGITHV